MHLPPREHSSSSGSELKPCQYQVSSIATQFHKVLYLSVVLLFVTGSLCTVPPWKSCLAPRTVIHVGSVSARSVSCSIKVWWSSGNNRGSRQTRQGLHCHCLLMSTPPCLLSSRSLLLIAAKCVCQRQCRFRRLDQSSVRQSSSGHDNRNPKISEPDCLVRGQPPRLAPSEAGACHRCTFSQNDLEGYAPKTEPFFVAQLPGLEPCTNFVSYIICLFLVFFLELPGAWVCSRQPRKNKFLACKL